MEEGENLGDDLTKDREKRGALISEEQGKGGTFGESNEEGDYCRICRGEATAELPLFYPCKCSGSIKFVHQDCLMEWLSHSHKKYCELCKTSFRFTKLYDHRMPQTLPLPLFIRQICLHAVRHVLRWIRYLLVGLVWLGWLPWSIRQVWRGLFWLADGSWGAVNTINGNTSSSYLQHLTDSASSADTTAALSLNTTDDPVSALPQMAVPISGFLGYSSSEFLLIKVVRFLYPNLFNWSTGFMSTGPSNGTAFLVVSERQPSFLSDIQYLKTLTAYQSINQTVVDVLEGQLICLLIVTAFILIFLIREWVINQQAPADLPADNGGEEVRPNVGDGALRGPARRRRRRVGEGGREERVRRIAVPRAHRRFAAPDADTEDGGGGTVGVPTVGQPANDGAEGSERVPIANGDLVGSQSPSENTESPQEVSTVRRPALQARNAFEDAANIRRTIEEGDSSSVSPEWPGLETFKDYWTRAESDPVEVLRIIREEKRQGELGWIVTQMERLQQQNEQSQPPPSKGFSVEEESLQQPEYQGVNNGLIDKVGDFGQSPSLSSRPESSDKESGKPKAKESVNPIQPIENGSSGLWGGIEAMETLAEPFSVRASRPTESASEPLREAPIGESNSENPVEQEEASSTIAVVGTPNTTAHGDTDTSDPPPTTMDALADWLWRTDENTPQADGQFLEDDEHLVEDVNQEAPFVPVPPAEFASDAEEEAEADGEQDPEVVAAAAAAGIGLNNPEAVEDAEDLDGILELIGMQGPLTGMVQNVIFSEFLITLTIAASVWLPYVWGKIALLLLANPFGVFVRAPLHLLSKIADTTVDISLFISGICVYMLNSVVDFLVYLATFVHPISHPWVNSEAIARMSLTLASGSSGRLEKAIFGTFGGLKPDLPTFSVLSHQALRVFQRRLIMDVKSVGLFLTYLCYEVPPRLQGCIHGGTRINKSTISNALYLFVRSYRHTLHDVGRWYQGLDNLRSLKLSVEAPLDTGVLDYSLVRWNTRDRIVAIFLGYAFFAFVGYLYIKISRLVLRLKQGEKVEGVIADSLNQAGGVMKVILIIGIEMIIFPLYCGLLLDVALMPLFEDVGFHSRLAFLLNAPMTALFVHWFVGTCYMFHFALFVSMCRKIMRKGVLYFIRDPDDPTFHPVRDVLERPIATQLSKIAFSGLVYGGLVILCLGGIVWAVSSVKGVFPIHWTSNEPILEFPIDLLFYNFLLPMLIRSVEPSKKLRAMYEWWFRKCARWLRLTNFLFNEQKDDEQGRHVRRTWSAVFRREQGDVHKPVVSEDSLTLAEDHQLEAYFCPDGTFVRAPGSDSVRIPKGGRVFLEVDENNDRMNGQPDEDGGPHGSKNDNFVRVYIPPMFRARIVAFVVHVWVFAAVSGIVFTVFPLSLGRKSILLITQSSRPPNDLYAFSVGLYLCGGVAYAFSYYEACKEWVLGKIEHYFRDATHALPRLWSSIAYCSGLAYMGISFGFILPFLFSTLMELYFVTPLHTYLVSTYTPRLSKYPFPVLPPTIHVVQTWTLGLVYLRVIFRIITHQPDPQTRAATAIRSILRQGFWRPDVRLATRAFILPAIVLSSILLVTPLALGWIINTSLRQPGLEAKVYRHSYPGILGVALAFYCALLLKRQVGVWRTRIRDDVYLIGERLHNFGEAQRRQNREKGKGRLRDRAVPERLQIR